MSVNVYKSAAEIVSSVEVGKVHTCQVGANITLFSGAGEETTHQRSLADLERFQSIVADLNQLADVGVIEIQSRHKESQTGKRLVDMIRFKRIV